MRIRKPPATPLEFAQLEAVGRRLERWRKTRKHRSRISEALWTVCVAAAREFGLAKTARHLRISSTSSTDFADESFTLIKLTPNSE